MYKDFDAMLMHAKAHPLYRDSLVGFIYSDKKGRFEDGTEVTTSTVVDIVGSLAYTRNSVYLLVEPV